MALNTGKELRVFGLLLVVFIIRDFINLSGDPGHPKSIDPKTTNEGIDEDGGGGSDIDDDNHSNSIKDWKPEKGGPGSKISAPKFIGPTVRILYCTSCGYQNAYDQYSQFIQEKYPEILVEGSGYPLPPLRKLAGQILTIMKFLVLGAILTNQWSLFRLLGLPDRYITWISENKIYVALLSFFLVNLIESQIASTGAFELYLDDVPVWSKIQTGRLPNPPELVQIIDNHMKFGGNEAPSLHLPPSS